jgi:hypothetical protein
MQASSLASCCRQQSSSRQASPLSVFKTFLSSEGCLHHWHAVYVGAEFRSDCLHRPCSAACKWAFILRSVGFRGRWNAYDTSSGQRALGAFSEASAARSPGKRLETAHSLSSMRYVAFGLGNTCAEHTSAPICMHEAWADSNQSRELCSAGITAAAAWPAAAVRAATVPEPWCCPARFCRGHHVRRHCGHGHVGIGEGMHAPGCGGYWCMFSASYD